jgi:hypothetical protein
MSESFLVLDRAVRADLNIIARLYAEIGHPDLCDDATQEQLIVLSYRLHNLYNAFENIFRNVAAVFENSIDEAAGWHAQLLQRMRLDLVPVRPALIDQPAYEKLDELRRFRHLFRSNYGIELDAERIRLVLRKALQLREIYLAQMEGFLALVRAVQPVR